MKSGTKKGKCKKCMDTAINWHSMCKKYLKRNFSLKASLKIRKKENHKQGNN